ncbi:MAG: hypothetical protein FWG39_03015 [Alphaproteobacteria bacterium]|nr:hypothetical protein [Alphaproteobacteria bacterium]
MIRWQKLFGLGIVHVSAPYRCSEIDGFVVKIMYWWREPKYKYFEIKDSSLDAYYKAFTRATEYCDRICNRLR